MFYLVVLAGVISWGSSPPLPTKFLSTICGLLQTGRPVLLLGAVTPAAGRVAFGEFLEDSLTSFCGISLTI